MGNDSAIEEKDVAAGAAQVTRVVGDDDDGRAFGVELTQQLHHLRTVLRVEIAGGLVGQQNQRLAHHRARDRDALLLAPGQLRGVVMDPVQQPHPLLVILVVIHVDGLAIIAVGVKRTHIAPDRRGLAIRLVGIGFLIALLYIASKGLQTSAEDLLFWGSLFAIWALHTLGLALLHIRSGRETAAACPFV